MISKKLVAASILAAMGTSAHALDPIKVGEWEFQVAGSVNAYYTMQNCDNRGAGQVDTATLGAAGFNNVGGFVTGTATGLSPCGSAGANQDVSNVQNGLLPGFIVFTAKTQQKGYDISGTISIDPGTSGDDGLFSGGRGQAVGDNRRVFLTFGNKELGTFKFGRDIGLFGQNAILNDMSLLAVGGGSGFNGAINTTLGSIGSGYVYTQFQPQMTYTSPDFGGLSFTGGLFQSVQGTQVAAQGDKETGFQGMATYALSNGKLWAAFVQQGRDTLPLTVVTDPNTGARNAFAGQGDIMGYEAGGTLSFGGLSLTGNYFSGEGLGTTLLGLGGADSIGGERDSDGYLLQATYKIGDTKFGVNYGESQLDATSQDRTDNFVMIDKNKQTVVGVYHNLTPSLTIAGEYITNKQTYQLGGNNPDGESDTFAIGAILFF